LHQQPQTPEFSKQDKLFCMMAVFVYVAQLFYLPLHLAHADHLEGSKHSASVAIHGEHHAAEGDDHHAAALGEEHHDQDDHHHDHVPHSALEHGCDEYFQSNRSSLDSSHNVAALACAANSLTLPSRAKIAFASIRLRPPQSRQPGTAWSRGPPAIA
jgi:hypothetical protein